jgi:hypothetical protein
MRAKQDRGFSGMKKVQLRRIGLPYVFGFVAFVAAIGLVAPSALPYLQPQKAHAAPLNEIWGTSSDTANIQMRWYSLRGYGSIKSSVNWPQRTDGCAVSPTGVLNKILPWHPNISGISTGDYINEAGDCLNRTRDAGTTLDMGAWLRGNGLGGWTANGSVAAGWYTPAPASPAELGPKLDPCTTLIPGGVAGLWGTYDDSDQFYATGSIGSTGGTTAGLYYQAYPSGVQTVDRMYSHGVTLLRHTLNLSAGQVANIQSPGAAFTFEGIGDDWMRVWVNGVLSDTSTYTLGKVTLNVPESAFVVGQNVISIQVADKIRMNTNESRDAGVCYAMRAYIPDPATYDLTPLVSGVPTEVSPGQPPFTVSPSVQNAGAAPTSGTAWNLTRIQIAPGGTRPSSSASTSASAASLYFSAPGRSISSIGSGSQNFPGSATTNLPGVSQTINLPRGTQVCYVLSVNPYASGLAGWRHSGAVCTVIGEQPYFSVVGGDVLAGAGVRGYNQNAPNYAGAGAQLAVLAGGQIESFISGRGLSSIGSGYGLSFANLPTPTPTNYGGGLSSIPPAVDPTPMAAIGTAGGDVSSLASGVYTYNGIALFGTVPEGRSITIVAPSGDVQIAGNLNYSYTSLSKVPRLMLIAQTGDIIIRGGVSDIHGILIAKNGTVYTCGDSSGGFSYATLGTTSRITACSSTLTIYGAVSAQKVIFSRTSGNWTPASPDPNPSERIFYSPEVWMHTQANGNVPFEYYLSLPPVL